jgi:methylated-DNA-protein-cysteine methyltransferase-like protein
MVLSELYQKIYRSIRRIPEGKVSTYGRIARLVGQCTPRMVGYALHALPNGSEVPWQRVINSQGKISLDTTGIGQLQRTILESEGIIFSSSGVVDLKKFLWTEE